MQMLRNVFRRKLRVSLTIFGITIGVLALVVMGSMAEKINLLVAGGSKYFSDKVIVQEEGTSMFMSAAFPITKSEELAAVPGVAGVTAGIETLLDQDVGASFGMPAMITGSDMAAQQYESFKLSYVQGRALTPADIGGVVVGYDLVGQLGAEVGGTVTVRGEEFTVVGILGKTLTAPDTEVFMALPDAQRIYYEQDLGETLRAAYRPQDLVTSFVVYPTAGTDPETLATTINETVTGVTAMGPSAFEEQIASVTGIFNAILYGIAIIALFVGGLSVVNTMTMSVSERTREIGVRKAIGASDGQIVGQFLGESSIIGLIGGVSGLFLGWLVATVTDAALASRNLDLFLVSPRLAIGSVAFAVLLGLVSGLYPSLHAARLRPVLALRYE
jgi:putative ABC transport system permease protein